MSEHPVPAPDTLGPDRCPRCGERFVCGMRAGEASCWCASLPPFSPLPAAGAAAACYCPACLQALLRERTAAD